MKRLSPREIALTQKLIIDKPIVDKEKETPAAKEIREYLETKYGILYTPKKSSS